MKKINPQIVNRIKKLTSKGESINKISRILKLKKSTVYYWYKKFNNKKLYKKFLINENLDDKTIGEFIGAFAGDGSYVKDKKYDHQIIFYITRNDHKYIKHISGLIKRIFDKFPYVYVRKNYNVSMIRIISKTAYDFLKKFLDWEDKKTYSIHLKNRFILSQNFIQGFLKGILDTDGFVNKDMKRIVFSTTSKHLAEDIEESLKMFNFNFFKNVHIDTRKNRKPLFLFEINHSNFDKFMATIQPVHE